MAYLLMILPVAFQVILVIHVFRTGRDRFWIYIIIFLPMAGGIAYLILEILIPFFRGSGARRVVGNVQNVIDPGRTLRTLEDEAKFAPTTANHMRLAEAYLGADRGLALSARSRTTKPSSFSSLRQRTRKGIMLKPLRSSNSSSQKA